MNSRECDVCKIKKERSCELCISLVYWITPFHHFFVFWDYGGLLMVRPPAKKF